MSSVVLLFLLLAVHPVHVSITSIEYVDDRRVFTVFVRLYFDDFCSDCRLAGIEASEENFSESTETGMFILQEYLNKRFTFSADGKKVNLSLENISLQDNELKANLVSERFKPPARLMVSSNIMTSLYADQANMLLVKIGGFEEGIKLNVDLTDKQFVIRD